MNRRLVSAPAASLLLAAGRITDSPGWGPFHAAIRAFYRSMFIPWFERRLSRAAAPFGVEVFTRHSMESPGKFNAFFSDIDFGLVMDGIPAFESAGPLVVEYRRISAYLKFVGEPEIYTPEEWRLRSFIFNAYGYWIRLIWNLRKWPWQWEAHERAPSPYHRYKAARSIAGIRSELGLADGPMNPAEVGLAAVLKTFTGSRLPPGVPAHGRSPYLGWQLDGAPLSFVAMLPDAEFVDPGSVPEIECLRRSPLIGAVTGAVAAWELLLCLNNERLRPGSQFRPWMRQLEELQTRYPFSGPVS